MIITDKQDWKHDYKAVVATILMILALLIIAGKIKKVNEINWTVMAIEAEQGRMSTQRAEVLEKKLNSSDQRQAELELKLKAATASAKAQQLTPAEAREMIEFTFPPELRKRFEQITMQCENGKLRTDAVNVNKDGSKDVGMSQINSKWHTKRVEKMFGMDFETAMEIPILNYIYAAFMVDHAQNFEAWVCDRIIKP